MSLNSKQKEFFELFAKGENIFLSGPAGVGKSFCLNELVKRLKRSRCAYAITATTGVAALNIGGSTLHSWMGIGLAEEDKHELLKKISRRKNIVDRITGVDVLIIDEVSMLSRDVFEKIIFIISSLRMGDPLQIIFVGDFFQLPPVNRGGEPEFCFESPSWEACKIKTLELEEVVRQVNDKPFANLLCDIRVGRAQDFSILENRIGAVFPDDGIEPVRLYCTNRNVDYFNTDRLKKIKSMEFEFIAEFKGQPNYEAFFERNCSAPKRLALKRGAQVMLLHNLDIETGLVNGSIGVVESFADTGNPVVRFSNGIQKEIEPHTWETKEQNVVGGSNKFRTVGKYTQTPLRLAWCITVHKSQGATIDRAIIDLGDAFGEGIHYVALSRVREAVCMSIENIDFKAIKVNQKVKEFYEL